jgi:transposase-like protein
MQCPHCETTETAERREQWEFNERSGTRFNPLQYPTDMVCRVVLWRVRYTLSLRDLPEMFLERGIIMLHAGSGAGVRGAVRSSVE